MAADLTIEQLAAETGMTVRNIRAHQARGLLDPPEVRLRVGYYGPEHVAQLRLIRDLQEDGFNLAGIKRLLDEDAGTARRLARFRRALTEPPHAERPQRLTLAELGRRFRVPDEQAAEVLQRAERLGVLVRSDGGTYEVPSPALLAVAERVVARGVSLDGALAVFEQIERHCDAVSAAFVALFMAEVWEPFAAAGMPAGRWPEIEESIEQLRPLATDALLAIFGQRMSAQIETAFGELSRRLQPEGAPGRGARTDDPAGRGGRTDDPAGRGERTDDPAGRGERTDDPAGRGERTDDPAGRGGRTDDPAGRGERTDDPAGRGGRTEDAQTQGAIR